MKEHYDILDICLKHKRYDIILSYSTNLTNIGSAKYNLIEYWQQFKDVRAAASIDAGWEQIEFIREGTNWNQLVDNFRKIRHLPGVTVTVAPVMAMWNMLAFPKAYRYLVDNNLIKFQPAGSDMGGEILDHEYLKPGVLPQHIKDHIKNTYYTEYRDYPELQILLRYLDQDLTHLLPKTKRYIDRLCKQTNSNFELLFPELKGIFDNVQ
jgi:hypothetical protein